jgi:hypothetical protein
MRNINAMLREAADLGIFQLVGAGGPLSGSSSRADFLPTGFDMAGFGARYYDTTNGVMYTNEGTRTNLYWTPTYFPQIGLIGTYTDFRDGAGKAHSDTGTNYLIPGSGVRVFGSGIDETDSGLVITQGANGAVGRLTSSATATALPAALGFGGSTVLFDPATNGPLVVDAKFTVVTDLLTKRVFLGFTGTSADALVSPVTGSTLTLTLVQDDVSGMMFDSAMTAATEIFAPHNKADEAASILTTATGVDTGVVIPAVGTYHRWRVEISPTGVMTVFINAVQVTQIAASASATVDVSPVLLLSGTTTAIDAIDIKFFMTWGSRVA